MRKTVFFYLSVLLCLGVRASDDKFLIADFERDGDKAYEKAPDAIIVAEHAKSGTHSLKVTRGADGYPGIRLEKPDVLKHFTDFPIFRMEIFNPEDHTVNFTCSAGDAKSTSYGTRYNSDGMAAKPGWSTLQVNLTGLTRSSSNNFLERDALDMSTLKFFTIFLTHPATLYFDDVRLEGDGLPKFDGLRAFAFGPSTAGTFAGFTGVHEKSKYSAAAGFGWEGSILKHSHPGNPDDLGGNFGAGDAFVVDLKSGAGAYVVNMCIDSFGEWGTPQMFTHRSVELNGKKVLDENLNGEAFMKTRYLRFEDDEDTPGMDLWERRVKASLPLRTFETEVGADGKLTVKIQATGGWAGLISYLVVYPKAKEAEGKAFLVALDKIRKDAFNNEIVLNLPKPDNAAPTATADETALGYIPFARSTEENINWNSAPTDKERGAPLTLAGCAGERLAGQFGIFPLSKVDGVKVTVGELSGPNAKIPASAVTLHKIRNFAKRQGGGNTGIIQPFILQPLETLSLAPAMTRGIWLTCKIPDDAAAGEYSGTVTIEGGGKSHAIPVKLTVYPFTLDKADDITISCTGSTAGHWRGFYKDKEFDDRWWKIAEDVMRDQAEHGMNAITGGPGMRLQGIKDGKADINFSDSDRWLALAVKYGLTKCGDSYQGLDLNLPNSQKKDNATTNEQAAKKNYNVGYGELIKIAYGAVEAHAKENHWPPRSYYLLDEPRPEFGNIESAKQLLEIHVQNAPETKFSGYYSPGQGRDVYFKLMPITIAHHTEESIKACVDAGKEAWTYTGGGARCDIGRWLFVAHAKGLTGFLRNGYQYVNSDAYYDFSDTEGSWAQVYPSKNGIASTVGWERTAEGVNDYRYLKTLRARIDSAKKAGAHKAEADAAEAFLTETLKPITVHEGNSAALKGEEWVAFRAELAKHISALK
jgi:hypothetical protein